MKMLRDWGLDPDLMVACKQKFYKNLHLQIITCGSWRCACCCVAALNCKTGTKSWHRPYDHLDLLALFLLLLLSRCGPLSLQTALVAVLLHAVRLLHASVLRLHRLPLHAPRPKVVLVLQRAAATSEQHTQPGHLGDGDHAGGVVGVQARSAGRTRMNLQLSDKEPTWSQALPPRRPCHPGWRWCRWGTCSLRRQPGGGGAEGWQQLPRSCLATSRLLAFNLQSWAIGEDWVGTDLYAATVRLGRDSMTKIWEGPARLIFNMQTIMRILIRTLWSHFFLGNTYPAVYPLFQKGTKPKVKDSPQLCFSYV